MAEITQQREEQKARLILASINMDLDSLREYWDAADDLGERASGEAVPVGYKRCGGCGHVKKLYLFNKNSASKTCTTGTCKECQRKAAAKSYAKTKKKRNYKKYYQANKEAKQERARKYYAENKEIINAKHRQYLQTSKGKKVMQKAHAKRAEAIANNKGIPYTRELVLDRDRQGQEYPICYLCGQPITDTSGAACHIDHVISIGNGGLDCFTNVAAVHHLCNLTKEKDDRNLSAEQVEGVIKLAEAYIEAHPEKFEEK